MVVMRAPQIILTASLGLAIFHFNNCSKPIGNSAVGSAENLSRQTCLAQKTVATESLSPFAQSKLQLADSTLEQVALYDVHCRRLSNQGIALVSGGADLGDLGVTQLPVSAVTLLSENDPCLIGASPNLVYRRSLRSTDLNDTGLNQQRHLPALRFLDGITAFFDQTLQIDTSLAAQPTVVAVIDTGAHIAHPDLTDNIYTMNGRTGVDATTLGLEGVTPVYRGQEVDTNVSHGTHVSGIVAARGGNRTGISGVAPQGIKIMPINVFFQADGEWVSNSVNVIKGILYAIEQRVDVINLSLGGPVNDPALLAAIQQAVSAGIFISIAAGNDGRELSAFFSVYPAFYSSGLGGVMSVGSVDTVNFARSRFSNFAASRVEIAAFGAEDSRNSESGILSIVDVPEGRNAYARLQGTSQAAPQVAAAAALVKALVRQSSLAISPAQIETLIMNSAQKRPELERSFNQGNVLDLASLGQLTQSSVSAQRFPTSINCP